MNIFFHSIGFNDDTFKRERLETDKRMFVYKMSAKLKLNVLTKSERIKNR